MFLMQVTQLWGSIQVLTVGVLSVFTHGGLGGTVSQVPPSPLPPGCIPGPISALPFLGLLTATVLVPLPNQGGS